MVLTWTESGGPPVAAPTRRGFGSRLIERSLRNELGGSASMSYDPEGFRCTLEAKIPPSDDLGLFDWEG
jgi:two-component sensor histidine kinase